MDSLERYLERSVLGLARTFSFAEYIKRMNMITQGGKPDEFRIPPDDRLITELLLRYSLVGSLGDFDPVVSRNYQFANIKVDLKNHNFSTIRQLLEKTKRWIRIHHKSKEINFLYAGGDIGMLAAENQLTGPMPAINSLGIVIIVLFFLIVAFGWFLGLGVLLLPLAFRALVLLGCCRFWNAGLSAEIIPLVILGVGFGDEGSIYIVWRIIEELKKGDQYFKETLVKVMHSTGNALLVSNVSLAVGVSIWIFSPFLMQVHLGIFWGLAILLNIFGALIILPSLSMVIPSEYFSH
jgi:predicted RND superfamily exporter protein